MAGASHAADDGPEHGRSAQQRMQQDGAALAEAPFDFASRAEHPASDPHKHSLFSGVNELGRAAQTFEVEVEIDADAASSPALPGAGGSATIRARRVRVLLRSDAHSRRRSRAPPRVE